MIQDLQLPVPASAAAAEIRLTVSPFLSFQIKYDSHEAKEIDVQ